MTSQAEAAAKEAAKLVGSTISDRYRIERLLGEGGMGAVYEAEHTLMHKRVAIKVLHAEMSKMTEVVTRFEREAMAAAHIEHPNVASATDFGKLDDGSFFLVLELIDGKSLRDAIGTSRFTVARALHVTRQIASALARAHGLGIVHRDLKPENVMLVTRDSDEDFVKVLDFGIAKVPVGDTPGEKALTQLGMVYGTPEYMPPEQALGQEVDRRADLYALGVITYEMLAGHRPFDDESKVKLLGKHITAPVPPLPPEAQVPPEVEALVLKLLAKDMADRVQEAREVIEAIDVLMGGSPSGALVAPIGATSSGMLPAIASGPVPSLSGQVREATSRPSLPQVIHPTVIALEAQAKSLAGDVTRIVPPKLLFPLIGLVAVIGFGTVVALVVRVSSRDDASSASSSSATAPATLDKPSPHFEHELKGAQGELGAGNYDAAITHARALANEEPARPEPLHLLFQAHIAKGDEKAALGDAAQWLSADPAAQSDAQLRDAIKNALASHDDSSAAFGLLESGKMGQQGADILYDIAYSGSSPSQARAKRALAHPDVTKHASAALEMALGLRNAKDCEAKKTMLDSVAAQGDARALTILESYAATSGCGFLGTRDCYSCMHKDGSLSAATAKLRSRVQ